MSVLNNVKCRWASVLEPNTKFDPAWEIEALLSAEQAEDFKTQGANPKKDEDGQWSLRFKRKTHGQRKDGGTFEKEAPRCVDMHKEPFTKLIGNGSTVNIVYGITKYPIGTQVDLVAVQVVDHVPYGGSTDPLAELDGEAPETELDVPF